MLGEIFEKKVVPQVIAPCIDRVCRRLKLWEGDENAHAVILCDGGAGRSNDVYGDDEVVEGVADRPAYVVPQYVGPWGKATGNGYTVSGSSPSSSGNPVLKCSPALDGEELAQLEALMRNVKDYSEKYDMSIFLLLSRTSSFAQPEDQLHMRMKALYRNKNTTCNGLRARPLRER
jgi:hypothetical protein